MELLVVIAVIGILAALLLPVISRVKDKAIRTKCLNNIKQFDLGLISYAHDNRERLPQYTAASGGLGPWLIDKNPAIELTKHYLTPDVLWDPGLRLGGPYEFRRIWDRWLNGYPGLMPLGYVTTIPLAPPLNVSAVPWLSGYIDAMNPSIVPQPVVRGAVVLPAPIASKRVLVAGIVCSTTVSGGGMSNDPAQRYTYDYTFGADLLSKYNSSFPPGTDVYDFGTFANIISQQSAHLDSRRRFPTGDNLGMLDGSAGWRKFKDMMPVCPAGATWWW